MRIGTQIARELQDFWKVRRLVNALVQSPIHMDGHGETTERTITVGGASGVLLSGRLPRTPISQAVQLRERRCTVPIRPMF